MRTFVALLICLASLGHGRKVLAPGLKQSRRQVVRRNRFKLFKLLLADRSTAGWQVTGHNCNCRKHFSRETRSKVKADVLENVKLVHRDAPDFLAGRVQGNTLETATRGCWPRAPAPVAVLSEVSSSNWGKVRRELRRAVYTALVPLDKGDFRWEFLVPWTNKTLTTLDKFIICSSFVGIAFTAQSLIDTRSSVGVHLAYIAQFFSYAMGDPIGYRSLALLTSVLEIFGNVFEPLSKGMQSIKVDDEAFFPTFYDEIFIIINAYYVLRWVLSREQIAAAVEWSEEQESLYTNCFLELGFRRSQFTQLLRSATFLRAGDMGDTLTVQDQPIYDLFVPISGDVEVRVNGVVATTLPAYQLVGEASLLENLQSPGGEMHPPSRATVVAAPGTAYVRWPQSAFYALQEEEDSDFAYAIHLMIARQLSDKLKRARLTQKGGADALGLPKEEVAGKEVKVLLARNQRYERRIAEMENSLQQNELEQGDLRFFALVGFAAACSLAVSLGNAR